MKKKIKFAFKKERILIFLLLLLNIASELNEISLIIDKRKGKDIIAYSYYDHISEVVVNGKSSTIFNYTDLLNNKLNNITIKFNRTIEVLHAMFFDMKNIIYADFGNFNSSELCDTSFLFEFCSSIKSININKINTSKVTNMRYMFEGCKALTSLDISNFDTSLVTKMDYMFAFCYLLTSLNLNNFNTSIVKDMSDMFNQCYSLKILKIDNFDTSSTTDISSMFYNCSSLISLNLTNFELEPTSYYNLFEGCNEKMKYCIDDSKEYDENIIEQIKNFEKNCSDICLTYNKQKFIMEKNVCLDKCSMDKDFKYEYHNLCYEKCPNDTVPTGKNNVCGIDDLDDKVNIKLLIGIIVVSIVLIVIAIIIIFCLRRKKDKSIIYNPLIEPNNNLSLIITTIDQQFNLPITCKKTDVINDVLKKEFAKEYKDYTKFEYYIICSGNVIDKTKTFEENNIKDKNILIINKRDDFN